MVHPPLIITELRGNHEGSLDTAFKMVDTAKRVGAEVVKYKTRIAEDEMMGPQKK